MSKITELENRIRELADAYYSGNELVSDKEYDELIEELRVLEPESELIAGLAGDEKDTNAAGYVKMKHNLTTGTLSKAMTLETFEKWVKSHKGPYHCSSKMDGCLEYNTLLETDKGLLPIGKIVEEKIICNVKAKDLEADEIIFTPVKNWFINENSCDWYELETDDGKKIKITGNHRVWLPKKGCWRKVEELEISDELDTTNYPIR